MDATVVHEFVWVSIGASGPEIIVGDVPEMALVIGLAPTALFAGCDAAILVPVAVGPTTNGIELA